MPLTAKRAAQLVALAMLATVVTQLVYMGLDAGGKSHIAYPIWRTEAVIALFVAVLGLVLARTNALVGGAIATGGIFNLFQTGMGLTMFYQLGYGGEGPPDPAFFPVLNFSFFLYFAAKAAFGIAGIALGMELWRSHGGAWKFAGLLAALTGLVALALNLGAMSMGMGLVFYAGGAGTAAAVFLAAALFRFDPAES